MSGDVEATEFIRRLVGAWDCCGTCAGGVLAQRDAALIAAAEQRGRETALREAADEWDNPPGGRARTPRTGAFVSQWLRERA